MCAYYNEFDPVAAQWLRNLIHAGLIAPGVVDDRSIEDVTPADLVGFAQVHLFAGIGGWSLALRQAGWPDDKPVWTGSCPCQPFSAAGAGNGFADERHLWPAMFWLAKEHRPDVIFGEQVDSRRALAWLDLVFTDLEGEGYACGATDFCAASVGAPHRRQRLYWVADANQEGFGQRALHLRTGRPLEALPNIAGNGSSIGMADAEHAERRTELESNGDSYRRDGLGRGGDTRTLGRSEGNDQRRASVPGGNGQRIKAGGSGGIGGVGDSASGASAGIGRVLGTNEILEGDQGRELAHASSNVPGPTNGFWRDAEWLPCTDGKARPVEPGTSPLAHGIPGRVVKLRAFGNAICVAQAAEFIKAYTGGG